jgi:hypothetical protein
MHSVVKERVIAFSVSYRVVCAFIVRAALLAKQGEKSRQNGDRGGFQQVVEGQRQAVVSAGEQDEFGGWRVPLFGRPALEAAV